MKPSFWGRPFEISFKDVLAIVFSGTFLYFCYAALHSKDALALVQTLIPPISIILGGYFVQESAAIWFQRSQGVSPYQQSYGQYGLYSYPSVPVTPVTQNITDSSQQVAPEAMAQDGGV